MAILALIALLGCAPRGTIVAYDGVLIGSLQSGQWHPKVELTQGLTWYTVGLGTAIARVKVKATETQPFTELVSLVFDGPFPDQKVVVSPRPTMPRTLIKGSTKTGKQEVSAFLRGRSPTPRCLQYFRVDLDGDGRREDLITGSSRDNLGVNDAQAGDYFVLLAKNSKVPRTTATAAVYDGTVRQFGHQISIVAIADLDGDRKLEVVTEKSNFAGYIVEIWNWNGKNLIPRYRYEAN